MVTMASSTSPDSTDPGSSRSPDPASGGSLVRLLRWPVALTVVTVTVTALAWLITSRVLETVEQTTELAPRSVRAAGESIAGIAARFQSGRITETFISSIPHLVPDSGMKLELVAFEAVETFSRTDNRRLFWDSIDIGTTTTQIRVPVVFRYHLRLDDPWHLTVSDRCCVAQAPAIRATLPPAIRTDGIERQAERGWARFNVGEQMKLLEGTLTTKLSRRAQNAEHIDLVREQCRIKVAEFVRSWLLREDHWRDDRFTGVMVRFADEPPSEQVAPRPLLILEPAG